MPSASLISCGCGGGMLRRCGGRATHNASGTRCEPCVTGAWWQQCRRDTLRHPTSNTLPRGDAPKPSTDTSRPVFPSSRRGSAAGMCAAARGRGDLVILSATCEVCRRMHALLDADSIVRCMEWSVAARLFAQPHAATTRVTPHVHALCDASCTRALASATHMCATLPWATTPALDTTRTPHTPPHRVGGASTNLGRGARVSQKG
jgi:hypothetical protein